MRAAVIVGAAMASVLMISGCGSDAAEPTGQAATWNDVVSLTYQSMAVSEGGAPKSLASEEPISISFGEADLAAKAGCNTMTGGARITDGVLEVGQLAMTRMACEPALMDQDQWLSEFLTASPTATIDDGTLTLAVNDTVIDLVILETVGFADSPVGGPESEAQVKALCEQLLADGATEAEAQQATEQAGLMFRVLSREGEQFPATMDYRVERLNVRIEGGVVTECTVG